MPTTLYLLRHGATGPNLEKPYRLQGSGVDEALAPLGVRQAEAARDVLRGRPLQAIYSSPLKRARQTAEILASAFALPVQLLADLREGCVGRWERRTWDDIRAAEPDAYAAFVADPARHGYPGGENFAQVAARVGPVFAELLQRHAGQQFAVVGHQIVNRVFLAELLGISMTRARTMKLTNGGISVVSVDDGPPQVTMLNAALHVPDEATRGA